MMTDPAAVKFLIHVVFMFIFILITIYSAAEYYNKKKKTSEETTAEPEPNAVSVSEKNRLSDEEEETTLNWVCPRCKYELGQNKPKFCPECGFKMS